MSATDEIMKRADDYAESARRDGRNNDPHVTTLRYRAALLKAVEAMAADAARYRWLRDRMQIRWESPISGGDKRKVLTMRVGHEFLDSKKRPESGWTGMSYFHECREKVDAAIDAAMKGETP